MINSISFSNPPSEYYPDVIETLGHGNAFQFNFKNDDADDEIQIITQQSKIEILEKKNNLLNKLNLSYKVENDNLRNEIEQLKVRSKKKQQSGTSRVKNLESSNSNQNLMQSSRNFQKIDEFDNISTPSKTPQEIFEKRNISTQTSPRKQLNIIKKISKLMNQNRLNRPLSGSRSSTFHASSHPINPPNTLMLAQSPQVEETLPQYLATLLSYLKQHQISTSSLPLMIKTYLYTYQQQYSLQIITSSITNILKKIKKMHKNQQMLIPLQMNHSYFIQLYEYELELVVLVFILSMTIDNCLLLLNQIRLLFKKYYFKYAVVIYFAIEVFWGQISNFMLIIQQLYTLYFGIVAVEQLQDQLDKKSKINLKNLLLMALKLQDILDTLNIDVKIEFNESKGDSTKVPAPKIDRELLRQVFMELKCFYIKIVKESNQQVFDWKEANVLSTFISEMLEFNQVKFELQSDKLIF